jgi:GNAT superfamily N-acetyltransferase
MATQTSRTTAWSLSVKIPMRRVCATYSRASDKSLPIIHEEHTVGASIRELDSRETSLAYRAMLELRPHIGTRVEFVHYINTVQRREGYRLVGSFSSDEPDAVAVAGFRLTHHLHWRRALYCDDLSTRGPYRGQGHAGALLDWMVEEAGRLRCDEFHLDSGLAADRHPAHRLYFRKGLRIASFHFTMNLGGPT